MTVLLVIMISIAGIARTEWKLLQKNIMKRNRVAEMFYLKFVC